MKKATIKQRRKYEPLHADERQRLREVLDAFPPAPYGDSAVALAAELTKHGHGLSITHTTIWRVLRGGNANANTRHIILSQLDALHKNLCGHRYAQGGRTLGESPLYALLRSHGVPEQEIERVAAKLEPVFELLIANECAEG